MIGKSAGVSRVFVQMWCRCWRGWLDGWRFRLAGGEPLTRIRRTDRCPGAAGRTLLAAAAIKVKGEFEPSSSHARNLCGSFLWALDEILIDRLREAGQRRLQNRARVRYLAKVMILGTDPPAVPFASTPTVGTAQLALSLIWQAVLSANVIIS